MFNYKKKKKHKPGFTLVELIIVIAIIGILSAVAIPQFNNVQARSTRTTDITNARNISKIILTLISQEQLILPSVSGTVILNNNPSDDLASLGGMDTVTDKSVDETIVSYFETTPLATLNAVKGSYFIATFTSNGDVTILVKNKTDSSKLIQVYPEPDSPNIYYPE